MDVEGFVNEISLLRKKLSVVDRRLHQMRLIERLGDDDRLDRMLQDLENKIPILDESDYASKLRNSVNLAEEVERLQSALVGIEQKLRSRKKGYKDES